MKYALALFLIAVGTAEFVYTLGRDDLPAPAMCTADDSRGDPIESVLHLQLHGTH